MDTLSIMMSAQPLHLQPTAPSPPNRNESRVKGALSALVVGIIAVVLGIIPILGILLGSVAIILGVLALKRRRSSGLAISGLVLGSLALLTSLMSTAFLASIDYGFVPTVGDVTVVPAAERSGGPENGAGAQESVEGRTAIFGESVTIGDYRIVIHSFELLDSAELQSRSSMIPDLPTGSRFALAEVQTDYPISFRWTTPLFECHSGEFM